MPGNAVPAVPVQAQPNRAERLTNLFAVLPIKDTARLHQRRIRKWLVSVVVAEQPGDGDYLVVHPAPLGSPWHGAGQALEQRVSAAQPAGHDVQPCPVVPADPGRPVKPARPEVRPRVE